eukprot:gnl/TRDRNA2_/TRDRNA2_140272_c0_seq1.p1 gnl/TRDRNA2_/TRDRNA2_140272_c0~~gnl/TRDRNA2_/TRDRNA2_140272_c0_seq1.p1  ORF type:complete len:201 (+),score=41.74 gnl/TRDRNA2_/TRDRNA2_140272_c0_seq1:81-683(+)
MELLSRLLSISEGCCSARNSKAPEAEEATQASTESDTPVDAPTKGKWSFRGTPPQRAAGIDDSTDLQEDDGRLGVMDPALVDTSERRGRWSSRSPRDDVSAIEETTEKAADNDGGPKNATPPVKKLSARGEKPGAEDNDDADSDITLFPEQGVGYEDDKTEDTDGMISPKAKQLDGEGKKQGMENENDFLAGLYTVSVKD